MPRDAINKEEEVNQVPTKRERGNTGADCVLHKVQIANKCV